MIVKGKREKRHRRHRRVRGKISGNAKVPRLCVFRSANHIYAQLIDDKKGKTLISVSDVKLKSKKSTKGVKKIKTEKNIKDTLTGKKVLAFEVGRILAQEAEGLKINRVVFDRGGYLYHGRVKALAEGAREGGLKF